MKRTLVWIAFLLTVIAPAHAESAGKALAQADMRAMEEFSVEYTDGMDVEKLAQDAAQGNLPSLDDIAESVRKQAGDALTQAARACAGLFAPAMMLALIRSAGRSNRKGIRGAGFAIRLALIAGMLECGNYVISSADGCIEMTAGFSDIASPVISVFLTALGRNDAAALISPAAALVGNICVDLFRKYGLTLCRFAMCTAAAGGFGETVRLDRSTDLLCRIVCWGTGFCVTMFTALTAIRSGLSASVDGVAVRAAKYAMDSVAPVIGSGVSDAWETYVSGIMVAKNAVGITGMIVLLAACALPVLKILSVLLIQNLCAALLEVLGDREAAAAVARGGLICRMTLTMCTGAIAVTTILLGAAMNAGTV